MTDVVSPLTVFDDLYKRDSSADVIISDSSSSNTPTYYAWTNSTYNATIYTNITTPSTSGPFYNANGDDITDQLNNADCGVYSATSSAISWSAYEKGYIIAPTSTKVDIGDYIYDRDPSKDIVPTPTPTPSSNTYVGDRLYGWNDNSQTHQRTLYAWTNNYTWLGTVYTVDPIPTIPFSVYGPENTNKTAQYVYGANSSYNYYFNTANATQLTYCYTYNNTSTTTYNFIRDNSKDVVINYPANIYTNTPEITNNLRLYSNTGNTVGLTAEVTNSVFEYTPFDGNFRAYALNGEYGYFHVYVRKDNPQVGDAVYTNGGTNGAFETYEITNTGTVNGSFYFIISESEAAYKNSHYIRDVASDVNSSVYFDNGFTSCLTGDTEVMMADKSIKQLKDIEVGDCVLSIDPDTQDQVIDIVIFTDKDDPEEEKTQNEYTKWTFSDGYSVNTVLRHRFYNVEASCFKYMDEWKLGEHTLTVDGKIVELLSSEVIKEKVRHYKITTKQYHNYFANGMLTGSRLTKAFKLENK